MLFIRIMNNQAVGEPATPKDWFPNTSFKANMTTEDYKRWAKKQSLAPLVTKVPPTSKFHHAEKAGYRYDDQAGEAYVVFNEVEDELESARNQALSEVTSDVERRSTQPVDFDGAMYDADQTAVRNVMGAIVNGDIFGVPSGFTWRDSNNIDHPMDLQNLKQFGAVIFSKINAAYKQGHQKKDLIRAATSIQQLVDALGEE